MNLPNLKELKKLAAVCRKAGIKTVKYGELEFTLSDELQHRQPSQAKKVVKEQTLTQEDFETDSLTQDALLFWSANPENSEEGTESSEAAPGNS